jgi:hypothetical protein
LCALSALASINAATVGFDARVLGAVARFLVIPGAAKKGDISAETRITRLLFCATNATGIVALTH